MCNCGRSVCTFCGDSGRRVRLTADAAGGGEGGKVIDFTAYKARRRTTQ